MGAAGGESFGKTDYDKLSFKNLSEGVVLVNGATQKGPENGPMIGGLSSLSMLAGIVFRVPPSVAAVFGAFQKNNALRVTGAEDITLTDHDDVVWHSNFSKLGSFLTGWPEGADYPKYGSIHGGGGHDVIYIDNPEFIGAGKPVGPAPAAGEADKRPIASQELRLTVYGDDGEDRLIARGGEGAILVGGAGRDFLYNTSWKGQLYGDSIDGAGAKSTDVFWWSAGSFVMDAGKEDILQFFGLPLTGGTNTILGLPTKQTKWAYDWVLPFVRYGLSDSNQLIVQSWLGNVVNHQLRPADEVLKSSMIVENFDFGEGGNWAHPARGDLNMTFRIVTRDNGPNAMNGFYTVWGALIAELDALKTFFKLLAWSTKDDPLVLDLDGDGIETSSKSQGGVHFDFNGDGFAEMSGWVGADDGLLVYDRDGNGKIDDISELFGAPGGSGFGELRLLDDDASGVIDAGDVVFDKLQVWRDLDQDGVSQQGELFSLADLGIASIDAVGAPLNVTAPSGTLLREQATFTRADGTTGNIFEAIFETNPIDTVFRGDRGTADWVIKNAKGAAFDAKGYGKLASLSAHLSNDLVLSDTVRATAAAMTTPDLATLRKQAAPVLGAWAASLATTRELTPVKVMTDANGAALVDRAVYVEDAAGGYWRLNSGAPLLDAQGQVIARPRLADFYNRPAEADGGQWRIEQLFSPSDRARPLTGRDERAYRVRVENGRAVVEDFGVEVSDAQGSYWRLASGAAVLGADGAIVERPTLADLRRFAQGAGEEWRVEAFGYNPIAALPFDKTAVYLIDGIVTQYAVHVTDAQGGFYVWSENLDRALELQHEQGRPSTFNLRNYAIDFETLPEASATDDSHYRVEVMSVGQFRYASALSGVEFRPEVLYATVNPATGFLEYRSGGIGGGALSNPDGGYASVVAPTLGLFDDLMRQYLHMSRAVAVRLASQGGLAEYFRGLDYQAADDVFVPAGGRELAPMLQAIFERAPDGEAATIDYLNDWNDILNVVYPDYRPAAEEDLSKEALFQMIVAAYENVGGTANPLDVTLVKAASLLSVEEERIVTHAAGATLVEGTAGDDIIYVSSGDQTFEGGVGADTYVVGKDFGHDTIRDVELALRGASPDVLRFAHVASDQVFAFKDGLDLVIQVLGADDVLTVKNQFLGKQYGLFGGNLNDDTEMVQIVFADGIVWNALDIAIATSHPLDSNDVVMGTPTMDVLDGGRGNDIMRGGRDGDIYIYKVGDGGDIIEEQNDDFLGPNGAAVDLLAFGDGIEADNMRFVRNGRSDDLAIVFTDADGVPTGDRLEIRNQFELHEHRTPGSDLDRPHRTAGVLRQQLHDAGRRHAEGRRKRQDRWR